MKVIEEMVMRWKGGHGLRRIGEHGGFYVMSTRLGYSQQLTAKTLLMMTMKGMPHRFPFLVYPWSANNVHGR